MPFEIKNIPVLMGILATILFVVNKIKDKKAISQNKENYNGI